MLNIDHIFLRCNTYLIGLLAYLLFCAPRPPTSARQEKGNPAPRLCIPPAHAVTCAAAFGNHVLNLRIFAETLAIIALKTADRSPVNN
jgi:hypothetical protein